MIKLEDINNNILIFLEILFKLQLVVFFKLILKNIFKMMN